MRHYAQIDADGLCFAWLSTHSVIDSSNMISVADNPESYVGRKYDAQTHIWSM